jgi:hypothetical protein
VAAIGNANECHPDLSTAVLRSVAQDATDVLIFEGLSGFGRIESISDNLDFDESFK